MRKLLTIFCFLLSAFRVFGAAGDVIRVEINTNGWDAFVFVQDFTTSATFHNGFISRTNFSGTNMVTWQEPSSTNGLVITLESPGYLNGVAANRARTVYGTTRLRKEYPDNAQASISVDGSGVAKIRVGLSEEITAADVNLSATVHAYGFREAGAPCNGGSSLNVSNNSTLLQWTPPSNWSQTFGWERIIGTTYRVSMVAFAPWGIDSVSFSAMDASGDAVTNTVTAMAKDYTYQTSGLRWAHYTTELDLSTLTSGDNVRFDFTVRPNNGLLFTTWANLYTGHTPLPTSLTNLYDPSNTLAPNIAVVDIVTGNDSNGRATNVAPADVDAAHYFATIPTAAHRVCLSNNYSGGIVYVKSTTTNIAGSSPTFSSVSKARIEIRPYPGESLVLMTNAVNTGVSFGGRIRFADLVFNIAGNNVAVDCERVMFSNVVVGASGAVPIHKAAGAGVADFTNCRITNYTAGFHAFGAANISMKFQGCNFNGIRQTMLPYLMLGCLRDAPITESTNFMIVSHKASMGTPTQTHLIWYNNRLLNMRGAADTTVLGDSAAGRGMTNCAFVQNQFSGTIQSSSWWNLTQTDDRVLKMANSSSGAPQRLLYNETAYSFKRAYLAANIDDHTHGFVTDVTPATDDGACVGNWSFIFGANALYNAFPETYPLATHGAAEYFNYLTFWGVRMGSGWSRFVNSQSDQRLNSDSPVFFLPSPGDLLDYDIDLIPRALAANFDPPGPSASGNARKGDFF